MSNTKRRLSTKGGYCEGECVFERSDCEDPTKWFSSLEMMMSTTSYEAHGGTCLLAGTVREMPLGRCMAGDELQVCSPNAASCPVDPSSSFIPDEQCTTQSTTFGACTSASGMARCSWSPDDCIDGEMWSFPVEGCTCNEVRVGGCQRDGLVYCAVSTDGCSDDSPWLGPLDITEATGTECYLCMDIPKHTPESDLDNTNPASIAHPVTTSAGKMNGDEDGALANAVNRNGDDGLDIIVTVSVSVLLLVIYPALRFLVHRKKALPVTESVAKTITLSIDISSDNNDAEYRDEEMDCEELQNTWPVILEE